MKCEDCIYWENSRKHPSSGTGECRCHSPVGSYERLGLAGDFRAYWPVTFNNEWCGEFVSINPPEGG